MLVYSFNNKAVLYSFNNKVVLRIGQPEDNKPPNFMVYDKTSKLRLMLKLVDCKS